MAGFDDPGVFFSDPFFGEETRDDTEVTRSGTVKKFKEFIRNFVDVDNIFVYRWAWLWLILS